VRSQRQSQLGQTQGQAFAEFVGDRQVATQAFEHHVGIEAFAGAHIEAPADRQVTDPSHGGLHAAQQPSHVEGFQFALQLHRGRPRR
jgi:hypothetical protein